MTLTLQIGSTEPRDDLVAENEYLRGKLEASQEQNERLLGLLLDVKGGKLELPSQWREACNGRPL